ncbi:MAG: hypothetical protein ACYC3I_27175 [Gemmataceae bacterium]
MFDELDRLRDVKELFALLRHYQQAGQADREAWQDRLAEMDSVEPRQLVKLHGELLAYGWLEQNTGLTPPPSSPSNLGGDKGGGRAVAGCYRITVAGVRALKQVRTQEMQTV